MNYNLQNKTSGLSQARTPLSHLNEIVEQYIGFVSFQYNLLKPYFITFFPLMM